MRTAAVILVLLAGCEPASLNLQPVVAVGGAYGLAEDAAKPRPAPAPPKPDGCVEGCKCNGTGVEPSGDKLNVGPCRCDDSCACKKKKAATTALPIKTGTICTTGTCAGWPPKNMAR